MSSDFAIEVRGVSKVFPVYERPHHRLMQFALGKRRKLYREFWALRDVDFNVARGDTLGIVGRNGSGKSTLLQVLCGTLQATAGEIKVSGRVSALLELGAGFNPEFTGRENAFLNGSLMGITRAEIEGKMPAIEAFADIGDFIDQPVKCYSSGMFVRLAFAVAVLVEPDILIVDEALSVGDEAFQRKCFSRIQSMREQGMTILFVSHSAAAITELCNRAILLDHGEKLLEGSPKFVVSRYQKLLYAPPDRVAEIREETRQAIEHSVSPTDVEDTPRDSAVPSATGDIESSYDEGMISQSVVRYTQRGVEILDPHLETLAGQRVNVLSMGIEYLCVYRVRFQTDAFRIRFGMLIKNITGIRLCGAMSARPEDAIPVVDAKSEREVRFQFRCLLAPGAYFLTAGVRGHHDRTDEFLDRVVDAVMFRVMPNPQWLGTALVDLDVSATQRRVAPTQMQPELTPGRA